MWTNLLYYVVIAVLILVFTVFVAAIFVAVYERISETKNDYFDDELRDLIDNYEGGTGDDT